MKKISLALLMGILVMLVGCRRQTPDQDAFPGFQSPLTLTKIWSVDVGRGVGKTDLRLKPAVFGGQVFAADTKGYVQAMDLQSGDSRWKTKLPHPVISSLGVASKYVLVVTNQAELFALDGSTGHIKWRAALSNVVLSSPIITRRRVLVQSLDGVVASYDLEHGRLQWTYRHPVKQDMVLQHGVRPILKGQACLAVFPDGHLVKLALDSGQVLSEYTTYQDPYHVLHHGAHGIFTSPRLKGNHAYLSLYPQRVFAYDMAQAKTQWQRDISVHHPLLIDGHSLFAGSTDQSLYRLDLKTGQVLWRQDKLAKLSLGTGPVSHRQNVIVSDTQGGLYWFAKSNGRLMGRAQMDNPLASEPLVMGERLLMMTQDGTVTLYQIHAS